MAIVMVIVLMVLLRQRHIGDQAAKPGAGKRSALPSMLPQRCGSHTAILHLGLPTLRLVFHFLALVAPVCASNYGQAGEMAPVLVA
jgi:hypothetical protein